MRLLDHHPHLRASADADALPAVVIADDVWRLYWQSEQDNWHLDRDFGPLRPAFAALWVEGIVPKLTHADGKWGPRPDICAMTGALVLSGPPEEIDAMLVRHFDRPPTPRPFESRVAHTRMVMWPYQLTDSDCFLAPPCVAVLDVTEDGLAASDPFFLVQCADGAETAMADWVHIGIFHPVLFAISLMNCRNTQIESVPHRPAPKRSRRGRLPAVRYSRIVLPGSARTMRGAVDGAGAPAPLHLVRGHFKTYTDEAPLFGKKTGTWWWGWQARGAAENGEVRATYEVKS